MIFLVTNFIATAQQAQGTCPEVRELCWSLSSAAGLVLLLCSWTRAQQNPDRRETWSFIVKI